jgi:hypothetical protein
VITDIRPCLRAALYRKKRRALSRVCFFSGGQTGFCSQRKTEGWASKFYNDHLSVSKVRKYTELDIAQLVGARDLRLRAGAPREPPSKDPPENSHTKGSHRGVARAKLRNSSNANPNTPDAQSSEIITLLAGNRHWNLATRGNDFFTPHTKKIAVWAPSQKTEETWFGTKNDALALITLYRRGGSGGSTKTNFFHPRSLRCFGFPGSFTAHALHLALSCCWT